MKDIIEKAYQDVENLKTFNEVSLEEYRKKRLHYQMDIFSFIKKISTKNLELLEIGSGSSALSYLLEQKELLAFSDCVELSRSRHEFAQKWKHDNGFTKVTNHNIEIGKYLFKNDHYNVITCIDNTFSYIGLYNNENEIIDIVNNIYLSLKKNGYFILEVSLFTNIIKQLNSSDLNIVQEFTVSEGENFIGLWEHSLVTSNIINIKSKYINKNCDIKTKEENSKIFTYQELMNLFNNTRFQDIQIYSNFKQETYINGKSNKLIMVCKK